MISNIIFIFFILLHICLYYLFLKFKKKIIIILKNYGVDVSKNDIIKEIIKLRKMKNTDGYNFREELKNIQKKFLIKASLIIFIFLLVILCVGYLLKYFLIA
jgi:hypothetical protein